MPIADYQEFTFGPAPDGIAHRVFHRGDGPPVILLHELFGLAPQCVELGDRLAGDGFRVYLPLLFGEPNKADASVGAIARLCLNREFALFAANASSPITTWLRALAGEVSRRNDNQRVGAIGMCLTGGFVLSMMIEPTVGAPVTCQPSLPITGAGPFGFNKDALGISPDDLAAAQRRHESGTPLLGLRFTRDPICPKQRMDRLAGLFPQMKRVDIAATDRRHSTLAVNFDPGAYAEVRIFLRQNLA